MLKFAIFVVGLLFIAGCGSSSPKPTKVAPVALPTWYTSPPKDSGVFIYGVAMGKNRDDAIALALSDMISKFGINIESQFHSKEKVKFSYASKTVENQITASVDKIKISNYEMVSGQRMSYNQFVVLLKTDKKKLADSLKTGIQRSHKDLDAISKSVKDSNILVQYATGESLLVQSNALVSRIAMVQALDSTYEAKEVEAFIKRMKANVLKIKTSLNFYVSGDKDSQKLVEVVKNHLTKNAYTLSNSVNENSIHIKLSTQVHHTNGTGIKIAIYDIRTESFNKNKQMGTINYIIKLRDNGDSYSLQKNASIQFHNEIKDKDLNNLLGIK